MTESKIIHFQDLTLKEAINLVGTQDNNLKIISKCFNSEIVFRQNEFLVGNCDDETFNQISEVLNGLYGIVKANHTISESDVYYAYRLVCKKEPAKLDQYFKKVVGKAVTGKVICPKTIGQNTFVESMEKYDIVFAIGPAGTGKTYLAVVHAVSELKKGNYKRIVLTRPAVEAGESLGFLPGDLKEKVDPYLTPLYDALHDMLGNEQTDKLIEKGVIEIAPLAYMRGRTLDDAFVILDEAQNTTASQMKMFLTRLGFNSKMVITGDITQIDLNRGQLSGLIDSSTILKDINEIKIMYLTSDDVVRHPLVQKIIESYARKGI